MSRKHQGIRKIFVARSFCLFCVYKLSHIATWYYCLHPYIETQNRILFLRWIAPCDTIFTDRATLLCTSILWSDLVRYLFASVGRCMFYFLTNRSTWTLVVQMFRQKDIIWLKRSVKKLITLLKFTWEKNRAVVWKCFNPLICRRFCITSFFYSMQSCILSLEAKWNIFLN